MSAQTGLVIEPLGRHHNREAFSCGIESLDVYLKRQATQDMKRRISRVFVASFPEDPARIVGYYTLSSLSIDLSALPDQTTRKLPKPPLPAALIGRLAVDTSEQHQGIGKMLLSNAMKRTLAVSDDIGIYAMVVDAINEDAESFYMRYGFSRLTDTAHRLFLPLKYL
jgi:GNAT superfamily N-acetyltransferase